MPFELIRQCNNALGTGIDFPTLWHEVSKPHPLVIGVPVQRMEGNRPCLEVSLLRGDWLVLDLDAKEARLR